MKKFLAVVSASMFLTGCASSATVEEQNCTVSDKEYQLVYSYECDVLYVEDQDIWNDLTVESRYRMQILDGTQLIEAEFLGSPQNLRFQ